MARDFYYRPLSFSTPHGTAPQLATQPNAAQIAPSASGDDMPIFALILAAIPELLKAAGVVYGDVRTHKNIPAVTAGITAIAQAVGAESPANAEAATAAAAVAVQTVQSTASVIAALQAQQPAAESEPKAV
jgi:hypothetical protein